MFAPPVAKQKAKSSEFSRAPVVQQRHGQPAVSQVQLLQRRIGNQALLRLLAQRGNEPGTPGNMARLPGILQAKLKIGAVNDPLEHEADRVADQVMRMPAPEGAVSSAPQQVSRECAECEEEEEKLQIKEAGPQAATVEAPASVHEVLRAPGQPLDAATRGYFEPRFGHEFSRVRVHTNSEAADSVRSVAALAYTVGPHMVFGAGQYQPHSFAGRQLIAHELTHVVQQSSGAHMVRRAVLYPAATVTTDDPIRRVLGSRGVEPLALTTPTVNGTEALTDIHATRLLKAAYRPTGVEPKNVPTAPTRGSGSDSGSGSGSGSGSAGTTVQCGFQDFDVKISATVRLPTAPSRGQWGWGPTYVAESDLGSPPAVCRGKTRIEVVMKGKPDNTTFYQRLKANEQEHVNDLKSASDRYLVPHYQEILALRGTGQDLNACKANLQAQLQHLPDDKISSFVSMVLADIQRRDVPGGHPTQAQTAVDPSCSRMEITAEPKPAPPVGRTPPASRTP